MPSFQSRERVVRPGNEPKSFREQAIRDVAREFRDSRSALNIVRDSLEESPRCVQDRLIIGYVAQREKVLELTAALEKIIAPVDEFEISCGEWAESIAQIAHDVLERTK